MPKFVAISQQQANLLNDVAAGRVLSKSLSSRFANWSIETPNPNLHWKKDKAVYRFTVKKLVDAGLLKLEIKDWTVVATLKEGL